MSLSLSLSLPPSTIYINTHTYTHIYIYIYKHTSIYVQLTITYTCIYIYIYIIHERSGATQRLWPMMARAALIEDRATVSVGKNLKFPERSEKNPPVANLDSMVNMKGKEQGPNRAI